ncbi:MAG: alpha-ketoglutarate-dependent dioxygenase AlkB [Thermoanaerobaculia bacterium]|nr:alpha-ketoglutarate-dependent dioxygenase AlkB [Thermoanaerobaculia bacterium]
MQSIEDDFIYVDAIITPDEERSVIHQLVDLELAPLRFRGQLTKRKIASFGLDYRPGVRHLETAAPIPEYLHEIRRKAAAVAGLEAETLEQALVTSYPAGSEIGWHVDQRDFGDTIVAVSLLGRALLKLRSEIGHVPILTHELAPRSIYVLRPRYRYNHQHMVRARDERISVTFRSIGSR